MSNDSNVPQIDMEKWGDRQAAPDTIGEVCFDMTGVNKPIVISVTADEIAQMAAQGMDRFGHCNPNVFNQFLLERFKFFGAPVEGTLVYKLAHGAIARVKPDPLQPQTEFHYMWLPAEHAMAIANARGRIGVA